MNGNTPLKIEEPRKLFDIAGELVSTRRIPDS
jgi:hypothetical protein